MWQANQPNTNDSLLHRQRVLGPVFCFSLLWKWTGQKRNIFIISGNLRYFAGRSCYSNRYQPHKWWTNGSSECQYLKSTCNEEGQVPYDNGTIARDRKCRCDYTNYYAFFNEIKNKCYCEPTKEDCSCYRKACNKDEVLTPDYDCVNIHEWTGRFVCPEYKPLRTTHKKELTTLCPNIDKDFIGTIQQTMARIANTVIFGFIVVFGVMTIVFSKMKKSSTDEITKIEFKVVNMTEDIHKLKNRLQEKEENIQNKQVEVIPRKVRDLHDMMITDWMKKVKTNFIETTTLEKLYSNTTMNESVTVIGSHGCGKTSALQYVASKLLDFEVIICTSTTDMLRYHNRNRNQVFIFDDVFETTTAISFVTELHQTHELMKKTAAKHVQRKMLFSSDIIHFKSIRSQILKSSIFTANVFDMLSNDNKLNETDAIAIAETYRVKNNDIYQLYRMFTFFPELCSRYASCATVGSLPYCILDEYLKELTNNDHVLLATLSLFVIHGYTIKDKTLYLNIENELKNMSYALLEHRMSMTSFTISAIEQKLDSLVGTYISRESDRYSMNIEMFTAVVLFFYHHHLDFILKISSRESLCDQLVYWHSCLQDPNITLLIDEETSQKYSRKLMDEMLLKRVCKT